MLRTMFISIPRCLILWHSLIREPRMDLVKFYILRIFGEFLRKCRYLMIFPRRLRGTSDAMHLRTNIPGNRPLIKL